MRRLIVLALLLKLLPEPLWADSPAVAFENSLGQKFVVVAPNLPVFCIWETRQKDYQAFCSATNRKRPRPEFEQQSTEPAVMISWEDATAFCAWLTRKETGGGRIPAGCVYRLPTSKEWSLAVGLAPEPEDPLKFRDGPSQSDFPWGGAWPPPEKAGNYHPDLGTDSFAHTSPVGSFPPNRFGLYDMGGNVWEWCADPFKNSIDFRILRGSSWRMRSPGDLLSSLEIGNVTHLRLSSYGFRIVLELPANVKITDLSSVSQTK